MLGFSFDILFDPCQVVLSARTAQTLKVVAEEITSAGGEAMVVVGDVSKVQKRTYLPGRDSQVPGAW